jgi:Predicted alternative thymidylate synthase
MRLIKPSFEILEQGPGLEGIYEQIELAGRTCYKSKRPEGQTAKDFVDRMIASKHYAMLEHGTVYLIIPCKSNGNQWNESWEESKYKHNPFSKVRREIEFEKSGEGNYYDFITTNLRVLVENDWLDDLQYLCAPTKHHEKRVTVRFTTDRGVSHEFVRHRVFSFAQESTRYCNYSKDKFGNELTFIIPSWAQKQEETTLDPDYEDEDWVIKLQEEFGIGEGVLYAQLCTSEPYYRKLLKDGWTPQQARQILPNALKTELVMTGFVSDWNHFFDLRARGTTGAPHPDAKALAEPLMEEFYKRNLLN